MNTRVRKVLAVVGGLGVIAALLIAGSGCNRQSAQKVSESEEYHADNDIVMTIRSVCDAFEINEPLNESDYKFEGVLTDGSGMPLYTDIMGSPGQWEVSVISDEEIRIRNLYLGDLLPDNLEQYIVQSMGLESPEASGILTSPSGEEMRIAEYGLPGGLMRIETSEAKAPNGVEGPLVTIILRNRE